MDKISYSVAAKALKGLLGKADVEGTSIILPVGDNTDRPVLGAGDRAIRANTDINGIEEWDGAVWKVISADITAVVIKGTDTETAILAKVGELGDVWVASDTLNGWLYSTSGWVSIGQLKGPQGVGVSSIALTGSAGLVDTYEVTFSDNTTSVYYVTNGKDGAAWLVGTSEPTTDGVDGDLYLNTTSYDVYLKESGTWGIVGNVKGSTGEGLTILGSFTNESELPVSGTLGDGYLINGYLYTWTGSSWDNVGLIQGPQGIQGIQGIQGNTGNGISSVTRTSGDGSAGTIDVYTVLFTDATTTTFNVRNGNDGIIDHIALTDGDGSPGSTDTYTAYADSAETQVLGTFDVYNGADGATTLGALVDVDVTTVPPTDGQALLWDVTNSVWVAGDAATDLGSVVGGNTVTITSSTGDDVVLPAATSTEAGLMTAADKQALAGKQAALVSGTNIKTIDGQSLMGGGNINVAPTAAQLLAQYATAAFGAVGTYVFAQCSVTVNRGVLYSGSQLLAAGFSAQYADINSGTSAYPSTQYIYFTRGGVGPSNPALSGTWRAMGETVSNVYGHVTLFLRVA